MHNNECGASLNAVSVSFVITYMALHSPGIGHVDLGRQPPQWRVVVVSVRRWPLDLAGRTCIMLVSTRVDPVVMPRACTPRSANANRFITLVHMLQQSMTADVDMVTALRRMGLTHVDCSTSSWTRWPLGQSVGLVRRLYWGWASYLSLNFELSMFIGWRRPHGASCSDWLYRTTEHSWNFNTTQWRFHHWANWVMAPLWKFTFDFLLYCEAMVYKYMS